MHSGFLSTGLSGRVFTLDPVPESTFLSTDLALLTPLNFPAPWLSRSSVHYELTGPGVPSLAEGGKNSYWNKTHHLVTT